MKKKEEKHKKLPFFGIGKLLPFLKPYRAMIIFMVVRSLRFVVCFARLRVTSAM